MNSAVRIVIFSTAAKRQKKNGTRDIEVARDKKLLQLENAELYYGFYQLLKKSGG